MITWKVFKKFLEREVQFEITDDVVFLHFVLASLETLPRECSFGKVYHYISKTLKVIPPALFYNKTSDKFD